MPVGKGFTMRNRDQSEATEERTPLLSPRDLKAPLSESQTEQNKKRPESKSGEKEGGSELAGPTTTGTNNL